MRKSIVKITTLSILLILVAALSVCAMNVDGYPSVASADAVGTEQSAITYIHFFSVNTIERNDMLWADSTTGKIQLGVRVSNPDDEVTLTVSTRNKSAVAGVDYVANSQTYTLTKASGTQYFTVETINTSAPNIVLSGKNSETGTTRIFEVVLCSISSKLGNKLVVTNAFYSEKQSEYEEGKDSFDCRVRTRYDYEYTQKNDGSYFNDYLYGNSFASAWFEGNVNTKDKIYYQAPSGNKEIWVDNNESYDFSLTFDRLIGYDYILKYFKNGWADVYYGGSAVLYESGWSTVNTKATLTLKDAENGKIYYSANYWDPKSSGAPILFGETAYAHGGNDSYRYHIEENSELTGYTIYNTNDPMYSRVSSYGFSSVGGKVYKGNGESVTLHITRDSTWKMVFSGMRIDSELYDNNAPTVQSTYLDNITNTDNKKLRLSVRFSEPVHFASGVKTDEITIKGFVDDTSINNLAFNYAGGSGTDTLYFDCDLAGYEKTFSKVSSIKIEKDALKNALGGKVCDYAYNFALSNNIADFSDFNAVTFDGLGIDMRTPTVTLSPKVDTAVSKSHTVTISVSDIAESGATLYYTWVKASDVGDDADKYAPTTYANYNTSSPTGLTVEGANFDGEYYLYVKARSAYGKETVVHSGQLSFDNTPVAFESVDGGNSDTALSERKFTIIVKGNVSDLKTLTMSYRQEDVTEWTPVTLVGDKSTLSFTYYTEKDVSSAICTVKANDADGITLGMGDDESKRFYFKFVTIDNAGNEATFETIDSLLFDTSERCKLSLTIEGTPYAVFDNVSTPSTTITDSGNEYKNTYQAEGFTLTFDGGTSGGDLKLALLKLGSQDVTENAGTYFDVDASGAMLKMTYKRKNGSDYFVGGYYTIQLQAAEDKASDIYTFYLMGDSDEVGGYEALVADKLITNKVWMLSGASYYYWSSSNVIGKTSQYNTLNNPLAFSSSDKAKEYVRFMELQDLSIVKITKDNADIINGKGTEYDRKANGENTVAKEGQTWIRYKSATWDQSDDPKNWNLYFYSDSEVSVIDTDALSTNLNNAVNAVVDKIMTHGSYVYLVEEDLLNARKVPVLSSTRVRIADQSATETMTGVPFAAISSSSTTKYISFSGDDGVYGSQYTTTSGESYPFAVQKCSSSDYTSVHYKAHDGSEYVELNVSGTYYLKDLIKGTGIFDIVERDENGVRAYSVYIDNSSPDITFTFVNPENPDGKQIKIQDGGTILSYNVKAFTIDSILDADSCAYVAIYNWGGSLKYAKHASELGDISLSDGRYIVNVYDRSGNGYGFTLRISSADLAEACSVTTQENSYIQFVCKYDKDEIYRFEIRLDNVPVATSTDALKGNAITFRDGGEYYFYVEDLYGNVYEETVTFTREAPEVIWCIEEDGQFVKVGDDKMGLLKTRLNESEFLITARSKVSFRFQSGAGIDYEFITGKGTLRTVGSYKEVVIDQTDNWQVKVYYGDYTSLYTIYSGKSDTSAPTIAVTTNRATYTYKDETDEIIEQYFAEHKNIKKDDVINLQDVSFEQTSITAQTVSSGETVMGGMVYVRVSDTSGLYKWSYTYNGTTKDYTENFPDKVTFGKEGEYKIVAIDKLGNQSEFSFTIDRAEYAEISVDNLSGIRSALGKKNIIATLEGAGSFAFVLDGEYFKLSTNGNNLVRTTLIAAKDSSSFKIDDHRELKDQPQLVIKTETTITEQLTSTAVIIDENDSRTVSAHLKDGVVHLAITLKDRVEGEAHKASVQLRVESDIITDIKYTETTLSDEMEYLDYSYEGDDGTTKSGKLKSTLYINKEFAVSLPESELVNERTSYSVYFSEDGKNYGEPSFFDKSESQKFSKQGYYKFEVNDIYGNISVAEVVLSKNIASNGTVKYEDGTEITYGVDFDDTFYSNYAFSLRIGKDVKYAVQKDGEAFDEYGKVEKDGYVTVSVLGDGSYVFTISDSYGNSAKKNVEIKKRTLTYSDGWLTGFNDKALKKSEGYTNSQVSFDKDKLSNNEVKFISVTLGARSVVVYDKTPSKDIDELDDYRVGAYGDGTYEIVFKDIYGNKTVKQIHYKSTSPLGASRTTRSMEKTNYTLTDDVLENGIWSNKNISLSSTASVFEFSVNGQRRDLPFSVDFTSESGSGKIEYKIEYLDEYGFEYEFTCVLYRANVEIDASGMSVKDGMTRGAVVITFDESNTARITVNGTDKGEYKSGTRYSTDGSYIISVYDRAGNVAKYSVKRDSVAEYCFYTNNIDNRLTSGEITNESAVNFAPLNNDSVSYYTVYRDGKEVDYDSKTFAESGKWEIVLADAVGNKDYFCFYIVTHAYVSFTYDTPTGYKITQMTCDAGAGKTDWIDAVDDKDDHSFVSFEESGKYEVVMTSDITGKTSGFSITIDKSVPEIKLDGATNGEVTKKDVKISGYEAGDTVYVYRDGKLVKETKVTSSSETTEITEKGKYKVVVVNEAGGTSEVEFERVYTANVATTALIIAAVLVVVIGLFVGLLFRKRSRIE